MLKLIAFTLVFSHQISWAYHDVVYGNDDRFEIYQKKNWLPTAQAVALMAKRSSFPESSSLRKSFQAPNLQEKYGLCKDQNFSEQLSLGSCSGFLIAPDLLLTAGHCVERPYDCENYYWIFDYYMDEKKGAPTSISEKNIFGCKEIISQNYDLMMDDEPDYTLIRLDRITGRIPLKLALDITPKVGDRVVMLGHPNGIPMKFVDNASVLKIKEARMILNLDAFKANSGSPVINEKTGLVIGILVNGENDYIPTSSTCYDINVMDEKKGGEKATLIQSLPQAILSK